MTADLVAVDVSHDWAVACVVQERFMEAPDVKTQALTHSARCRQMRALGGDCFDFLPLPGRRVALTVADASGKGLPAALIIANVQSSLRTAALFAPEDAAAVVEAVNRQLHASSSTDRYATLFYGVFDEDTRTLQYVNAGHNPPMVIRADGSIIWLESGALPVGVFADTVYKARAVQLNPGDLIVAYTDGVVEAVNPAGEEWGVGGLLAALAASQRRQPDRMVQAAFNALDEFSDDSQTDDATILAARVN
jgi:sigma-B regulation protein RsbU (phosphoserine phosphatase)